MVRFSLLPREKVFFELYEESADNMVKTAQLMKEMIDTWEDIEQKVTQIHDCEHVGDAIVHKIFGHLHRTFVTPFDREDMASLAQTIDDVVDSTDAAADAIHIYKIRAPRQGAKELADIIVLATTELQMALHQLRNKPNLKQVLERCVEVNRWENSADQIFRSAMAQLFDDYENVADIIKWREVYEHMELATDRAEDVANILEGIALKHA